MLSRWLFQWVCYQRSLSADSLEISQAKAASSSALLLSVDESEMRSQRLLLPTFSLDSLKHYEV
jgi:hypothetical protein